MFKVGELVKCDHDTGSHVQAFLAANVDVATFIPGGQLGMIINVFENFIEVFTGDEFILSFKEDWTCVEC